ncbi:MAG: hypothetical protein R3A52_09390 [Polyangiales bacterium]
MRPLERWLLDAVEAHRLPLGCLVHPELEQALNRAHHGGRHAPDEDEDASRPRVPEDWDAWREIGGEWRSEG